MHYAIVCHRHWDRHAYTSIFGMQRNNTDTNKLLVSFFLCMYLGQNTDLLFKLFSCEQYMKSIENHIAKPRGVILEGFYMRSGAYVALLPHCRAHLQTSLVFYGCLLTLSHQQPQQVL